MLGKNIFTSLPLTLLSVYFSVDIKEKKHCIFIFIYIYIKEIYMLTITFYWKKIGNKEIREKEIV